MQISGYAEYSRTYFDGVDALHDALQSVGLQPGSEALEQWEQEEVIVAGHTMRRNQALELAALAMDTETIEVLVSDGAKSGVKTDSPMRRSTISKLPTITLHLP